MGQEYPQLRFCNLAGTLSCTQHASDCYLDRAQLERTGIAHAMTAERVHGASFLCVQLDSIGCAYSAKMQWFSIYAGETKQAI